MKIGILETGRPPEELAGRFKIYPAMVADWLGLTDEQWSHWAALDGDLPDGPGAADLWVITGSKFSAYDDLAWIRALEEFIRTCRAQNVPMVGICFGHQLIAKALGGEVVKADQGWGLGVQSHTVTDWPTELGAAPQAVTLQVYHQDQVSKLPDGAEVIAASDFCPIGAAYYPGFAVTVQGHPEFTADYADALIKSRRGTVLSEQDADGGLAHVRDAVNRNQLAEIVRRRFLEPIGA